MASVLMRGVIAVLASACVAVVAGAAPASAGTGNVVGNPGPFNASISQGTMSVGSKLTGISIVEPGRPVTIDGQVAADGSITVPASGVSFPPISLTNPLPVTITLQATGPASGAINPQTGVLTLSVAISAAFDFGSGTVCTISPIDLNLTTGTSGSQSGSPYARTNGTFKVVDGVAAVPAATGPGFCTLVNSIAGLPSPSGANAVELAGGLNPVIVPPGQPVPPPAPPGPPGPPPPPPPPACASQSVRADDGHTTTIDLACAGIVASRAIVTQPANGTLGPIDQAGGTVAYTPNDGYTGPDSFTWSATNAGGTVQATVAIGVVPLPPTCKDTVALVEENDSVRIKLPCTGPVDRYRIVTRPRRGRLGRIDVDRGTVVYRPQRNTAGIDRFRFTASDAGGTSEPAEVRIAIHPEPAVTLARRTAPVRRGVARVRLRCGGRSLVPCRGRLSLRAGVIAFTGGRRAGGQPVIGTAGYTIRPGRAKTVRVRLDRTGRAALAQRPRLRSRAETRTRQVGNPPRRRVQPLVLVRR